MQVAVWDTYVKRKNEAVMHFDIIVPTELKDADKVYEYGKTFLKTKGEEGQPLTTNECRFCHIEHATEAMVEVIEKQGYYILEMENCTP